MKTTLYKVLLAFVIYVVPFLTAFSQDTYINFHGYVIDAESGIPLSGSSVRVFSAGTNQNTVAKDDGSFQLEIPRGRHSVIFSFIGYLSDSITIDTEHLSALTIRLSPVVTTLDSVTVSSIHDDEKLQETETGHVLIKKKDIENLPYLLGEIDPIRILQLMPGIQTAGEGSTGYYVRGGAIDQNLMLLDNATVYNPSHLFGFFSVFNGATINSLELYKSGVPSYYGGRLSSVTKVNTRKGSTTEFKGEGSIGLIATNLLIEGPIVKNKGSFLIAARRTYVDLFARMLHNASILKRNIDYYFFDLNINLDYNLTPKDNLSFRSYAGKDDFKYSTTSSFDNTIMWKNKTAVLHWQHNFNNDTYSDFSIQASLYDMNFGASINSYAFKITSGIGDAGFTYQINTKKGAHDLAAGLTYVNHTLRPNNINAYSSDVQLTVSPRLTLHAHEAAIFVNDKIKLSDDAELSAGIRLSAFTQVGPFTRYIEDENFQILDTIHYTNNKWIKKYINPEPRIAFRYRLNSESSVKVSYDRTFQYMHMAPLSSVSLPLDIWVPSSSAIKPQSANQYSVGYFRNFFNNEIETSAVLYYKSMYNQIEYRQGVIIGYSKGVNFDDNFVFGRGTSYGSEFSIKKNKGRLNGQISYTLSRTTRKFPDLNKGKVFPAKYDRLHDLSVMVNFVYNTKWTFSTVFVYGTGNALNLPIARYVIQGNIINEYGARNSFRMPAYHRMDLGITYTLRKTNKYESYLILSVYNLYNRRNPYYIYFETKGDLKAYELSTSIKQVSLFPIIPALTYRFKF